MKFHQQQVGPLHILAYMEFQASNNLAVVNIANHMAAIKAKFALYNQNFLIKWTKSLQSRDSVKIVKTPSLVNSELCPVHALKIMLKLTPSSHESMASSY